MRPGGRLNQPIVLAAVAIVALLAVLIAHGGFQRPLAYLVWPLLAAGLVFGFLRFSAHAPRAGQKHSPATKDFGQHAAEPLPAGQEANKPACAGPHASITPTDR